MLKKVNEKWHFASESNLEDFVWSKLNSLFGLSPLKRQYTVYGDICDILALDGNSRLVVIELKNTEDRYIVQLQRQGVPPHKRGYSRLLCGLGGIADRIYTC